MSSRVVYENPWVSVREDAIEREDGCEGVHAVIDRNHGALIVPWDGERVTLVGQVKYPVAGEAEPEATEVGLETRAETPAELDRLIAAGEITDAATLAALHLLRIRGVAPWA